MKPIRAMADDVRGVPNVISDAARLVLKCSTHVFDALSAEVFSIAATFNQLVVAACQRKK